MSPYPGDHSVIVLDNCRIHHSDDFKELIENVGGYVVYTAPYTPKDNPIELVFSKIKAWLKRNNEWVETVRVWRAPSEVVRAHSPLHPDAHAPPLTPPTLRAGGARGGHQRGVPLHHARGLPSLHRARVQGGWRVLHAVLVE